MPSKKYIFLIYLQLVSSLQLHTTSRLSGFVLVNNNITYVEKLLPSQIDVSVDYSDDHNSGWSHENFSVYEGDVINPELAHVRFEPPILYFRDKVVGTSYRERVLIFNTSHNKTLSLEKVAGGKTSHIQIAAFDHESISPGGNSSFDIIFIGHDLVPSSTHFYIHTSKGILKYDVISWCVDNPFEITPLSSISLPLNSTYTRSITLRNPYAEPLQVTEALLYNGQFFSYSLPPSVDSQNAIETWTIKPYETKEILRINFAARETCNVTTFQSIKLSTGTTLVIPIEVEVTPNTGLYIPSHEIDFETGGHLDPPAVKSLLLCSSAQKTVTIENVSCEFDDRGCEVTDFEPVALPPSSCAVSPIAKVKFIWNAKLPGEVTSGALLIKNDLDPFFRLNYSARVHHGGLTYNSTLTQYVTGVPFQSAPRPFVFTNEYRQLVAVSNVYLSFEAAEYFHIRGFEPSVLKPSEQKVLFHLQMRNGVELSELKLDSSILLETNISTIRLPLKVYDGFLTKLSKVSPSSLNLGLVSTRSMVVTNFAVLNENPETIFVKYFGCNDSNVKIELVDVQPGNARTFLCRAFANNGSRISLAGGFNVRPHHYASFKLSVETGDNEEEVFADVWVQSDHEKIVFPLYMNVAKGFVRVSPDPFAFEDCFPGAYCVQQLTVESHFMRSMSITNISTVPYTSYDKLLFYPSAPAVISAHSTSIVGNILWEPTIDSTLAWPLGYLGLPNNGTGRDRWLGTIERPNATRDLDLTLMESQYLRFREQFSSPIDLVFRMDTTEVRNFLFKARIQLQWPQIVTSRVIDFPLVQIGSTAFENVTVFNPMHSHYLTVQIIMGQHYPQEVPTVVGNIISEFEEPGGLESKSNEFFLVLENDSPYITDTLTGNQRTFCTHRSSLVFVLPPQANATVRVGFTPTSQILTTTRLYIRNDFTILDSVALNGAGAFPQLTLNGLDNTATNLIKFSIPFETLKLCEENNDRVINITTKRVFRLQNTGQVSVHIFGFTISGLPCQGYGFKITNCHNTPFVLKPGMSKRVEVSFTPDFTSARVESILHVESDIKMGSMLSYTLYAALDYEWLCKCRPHLQRPYWEPLLYYLMIGIFFSLLIGVTILAVYEVSANTSRLINTFESTELKVQPVYDTKSIENFFVRSRAPHHHSHSFHHHFHNFHNQPQQNGARRVSPTLSNGTGKYKNFSNECAEGARSKSSSNLSTSVVDRKESGWAENNKSVSSSSKTTSSSSSSVALSVASSQVDSGNANSLSSHSFSYNCNSKTNEVANAVNGCENSKSEKSANFGAGCGDKQRAKNASNGVGHTSTRAHTDERRIGNVNSSSVTNGTECTEETPVIKTKRNRRYDLDDVNEKSNYIKKKHMKKEEKLAGNKFLKNGWTKCLKNNHIQKEAKLGEDETCIHQSNSVENNLKCNCPSNSARKDVPTEVISSSNVSSHGTNNSKFSNKDPRKLDINKSNNKKSNNDYSATESVSKPPSSPKKKSFDEEEINEELSYYSSKTNTMKNMKQKRKKNIEIFNPTTKDSAKENCSVKVKSEICKKTIKEEKISNTSASIQNSSDQRKIEEALKPITNLPKVKEPFETLSSLCNGSVGLKNKRKSNGKKRSKEEKFVNIAKELSIVFANPETLNHKSDVKKSDNVHLQGKNFRNTASPPLMAGKRASNGFGCNGDQKIDGGNLKYNHCNEDEETRLLNEYKIHSSSYFSTCNGELYSRVVAASTSRSSPSSSLSDSTGSHESPTASVSAFPDNQQNLNGFWGTWSNMVFPKKRNAQSTNNYVDAAMANEVRKETPVTTSSFWSAPDTVTLSQVTATNRDKYFDLYAAKPSLKATAIEEDQKRVLHEIENGKRFKCTNDNETARENCSNAAQVSQPTVNDIWGPPTTIYPWSPSDLAGSSCPLTSDAVSAISLSRLLRFEDKKDKEIEQYGSFSSLWSADTKSLWTHPKQE